MTIRKIVRSDPLQENGSNGHLVTDNPAAGGGIDKREVVSVSNTAVATAILSPVLITAFLFIFGGCCSNVYTLESILSLSPETGPLVTFLQFVLTALFTLPSQLTRKAPVDSKSAAFKRILPRFRSLNIPLLKWVVYTILFLAANVMNNAAFKYRIGVPLHIILRSAGPVTSMLVGYVYAGRKYPTRKVFAVLLLFSGVVLAALSDASSKGNIRARDASATSEFLKQIPGFILLFLALVVSAFLGIYTDELYRQHGRNNDTTNENLFYSHLLAIPFFAAQFRTLHGNYQVLVSNAGSQLNSSSLHAETVNLPVSLQPFVRLFPISYIAKSSFATTPILLLLANALTQIVCITGVNRLATQTSALTVSIVLNIRKLVSLLLSIWLFGNKLSLGVSIGAAIVFLGGGLYSLPSTSTNKLKKR